MFSHDKYDPPTEYYRVYLNDNNKATVVFINPENNMSLDRRRFLCEKWFTEKEDAIWWIKENVKKEHIELEEDEDLYIELMKESIRKR